MKPDSRIPIHFGVNIILAPAPVVDRTAIVTFQNNLLDQGLEYDNIAKEESKVLVLREKPTPLQITVGQLNPPVGQLVIVSPNPGRPLDVFIDEAEAVARAFIQTWNHPYSIVGADTALRELHETTSEHAFQEIWETRLLQPPGALDAFQRPIRAGGLRFVLDPLPGDLNPTRIEVKIESFIQNTRKIFIETLFFYLQPPPETNFEIRQRLIETDSFVKNQVVNFFKGENQ
ncbi:MAG TPA: hypothetical protein VJL34_11270 [Anaerolineales bacterium]|nr:hypothetical protein [Anaerolineales bacterium]